MGYDLLVIVALVLANGLFAGAEIAVLTTRPGRARTDGAATAVRVLRASPERFLATVQIGITVVGSAAAAFGGSRLAGDLAPLLRHLGLGDHAHDVAFAVVVAIISFLSLVFGELVPKSLALRYADGYATMVARPLFWLSRAARPLVWLLTASSNLVLRVFGDRTSFTETHLSRAELREMVEDAGRAGHLDDASSEIAARAIGFGEVAIAEVMVPRERVVAVPLRASPDELRRLVLEHGHGRMPVYGLTLDHIVGYVIAHDILSMTWQGGLVVLDDIVRPAYVVQESARVSDVLRTMQATRVQLVIIVDERGGLAGIATIEDLVEELVGDIAGEDDVPDEVVRIEATGAALVPGWASVRKVNRLLGTDLPSAPESRTIAGLCMALALMVPAVGARLRARDGSVLEVVDGSAHRVRTVRIHRGDGGGADEPEPA
jgi:putative hemolysin